jgi:uncharacterized protein DUF1330
MSPPAARLIRSRSQRRASSTHTMSANVQSGEENTWPDAAAFEEYRKQVPATIAKHGGRYLVRGGRVERVEGTWNPKRLVVLEFRRSSRRGGGTTPKSTAAPRRCA